MARVLTGGLESSGAQPTAPCTGRSIRMKMFSLFGDVWDDVNQCAEDEDYLALSFFLFFILPAVVLARVILSPFWLIGRLVALYLKR
jgi:hypothetical protein